MSTTTLALCVACSDRDSTSHPPSVLPPSATAGSEVLAESFDELYPIFLKHRLPPGSKAALWPRYHGRWVRWTGQLVSFTPNGLTIRQIPSTVTFDVSLWVEFKQRSLLRDRLKAGQTITYVGLLDSYDDVFRTFYLTHGVVTLPSSEAPADDPTPSASPSSAPR